MAPCCWYAWTDYQWFLWSTFCLGFCGSFCFVFPSEGSVLKSIKSTVCVQGYSKNISLGDLFLGLTVARSRATQDAFILPGVDLPLRTLTSNETCFWKGGDLLVCMLFFLLYFLPEHTGNLPDKDGCFRTSEWWDVTRNKNMTWGVCFSSQEAICCQVIAFLSFVYAI